METILIKFTHHYSGSVSASSSQGPSSVAGSTQGAAQNIVTLDCHINGLSVDATYHLQYCWNDDLLSTGPSLFDAEYGPFLEDSVALFGDSYGIGYRHQLYNYLLHFRGIRGRRT